jgi:hypothetical protein
VSHTDAKNATKAPQTEWLEAYLYDRWQQIRRNEDYFQFAKGLKFDKDGFLADINVELSQETKAIKRQFGLSSIIDPTRDIPKEWMLELPIFEQPLAVSPDYRPEYLIDGGREVEGEPLPLHTLFWDEHYIKLNIDVSSTKSKTQILSEVWMWVENARAVLAGGRRDKRRTKAKIVHLELKLGKHPMRSGISAGHMFASLTSRRRWVSRWTVRRRHTITPVN